MNFILYTNFVSLCILVGASSSSDDEVSKTTLSDADPSTMLEKESQKNVTVGSRKRTSNFNEWKNKAVSKLNERYRGAFEAKAYTVKNDKQLRQTPMIMNPNSSGHNMRDIVNAHLLDSLGLNNTEKKQILDSENSPKDMYGPCYISTFKTFMKHCYPICISYRFGGLLYVKNLLARACKADWLNIEEIKKIILDSCGVKNRYS